MAEEAIENELNCSICLDTYTDPKILQCFHVYCQKCLVKLVIRNQQGQLSLSCPNCRQVTPVPASGTTGLQSAFHINRLLEILDQHRKAEGKSSSAEERVISKPGLPSALCCSEHSERELELSCETCGELICYKCAIKGGKHHSHDYIDINQSFEKFKEEVAPSVKPQEKRMMSLAKVLTQLDRHCDEITHQHATIEADIRESSKRLHDIISNRQDQLISQLNQITKRKLKSLTMQRDQIEILQAQLSSCLEFTKKSLKTDNQQREVLVMKTNILKQVQELANPSMPDTFILSTKADVVFSGSADVAAVCESYGSVYALDSLDPSKCIATGRGTEVAVVGEKAIAVLEMFTTEGEVCGEAAVSTSFQVELVSEITGGKVFGNVERSMELRGQGQYVISYQPTVKGRHQLHIKYNGSHIRGSPFYVTVTQPVEKLGTPILTLNTLKHPWSVTVNRKGEIVVAEWSAHSVSVFSPCGENLYSIGTSGFGEDQFKHPSAVAIDEEGNLLVVEWSNHRIRKFTADGSFLKAVGSYGSGPLQFKNPTGITYSASNNMMYVADTENHRIQVLTPDLKFFNSFGKYGRGRGQLNGPFDIAVDTSGRVYVNDCRNSRIQVFTADGRFLRMFGRRGPEIGELDQPVGVCVDASGLVYISEIGNYRVSVFTSEGRFVLAFGSKGREPGQFITPRGLHVDNGVLYVCDANKSCVQLF